MTRLLRLSECLARKGQTRSPFYSEIQNGLMTKPVKTSLRAVAWPDHEVDAVVAARIAGASADEIRALVERLHAARKGVSA